MDIDKYEKIKSGCYVSIHSGRYARNISYACSVSKLFTAKSCGRFDKYYYVYLSIGGHARSDNVMVLTELEVEDYFKKERK